jgi:N-acylneuraminate cytidylyltransferase/CMP-N,N'-diacetyllegionaminic acid synthase
MFKKKKILALIPARGGSKGLPGKNIRTLFGKPLIAWSIEAGLNSKYVDRVVVTTDDQKIASVAKKYGAEIPFMRPKELANDKSSSIDVVLHALDYLKKQGSEFDYIILLEPTSPLRETEDVDKSIEMLVNNRSGAVSIVGVSKVEAAHPMFDVKINKRGLLEHYMGSFQKYTRRQEIDDLYFFEGTVYISQVKAFIEKRTFYHEKTLPYIVPRWKSIEIDDIFDLVCAEAVKKQINIIKREK